MEQTRHDLASIWGSAAARSGRAPRVLGFFAHPDDEVFCAGGTIAQCAAAGAVTAIVSLTQGEAGQIRDIGAATRRTLATVRVKELERSGVALGADHVTCLDLGDGRLAERSRTELAAIARSVVDDFEPDAIITFGPDGATGHPDHVASSLAMLDAVAPMAAAPRLLHAVFPRREPVLVDVLADWLTSSPEDLRGTAAFGHALTLFAGGASMPGCAPDRLDVRYFPAGSFLAEQGEPASELFCILTGSVDIVHETDDGGLHHLRTVSTGSFVGANGVAGGGLRQDHVVPRDHVTCLVLAGRPSPHDAHAQDGFALDVRAGLDHKLAALAAHRSQYAMDADLIPRTLVERLLGTEHFRRERTPRSAPWRSPLRLPMDRWAS